MSKQTIIDWQRDGLIVATGSNRGSKTSLDKLSLQAIGGDGEGASGNGEEALHRAVKELGLAKGDTTVIASREMVEVRTVSVPRVDADELPDIIRFQAQRQLSNMGETWPLDFILLPDDPSQEMQTALVGVVSPAQIAELENACTSAGLQLSTLALRPIEIARFALTSGALPSKGNVLLVCMSDSDADLMILSNGRVIQVRGTKLPESAAQAASTINGEIRRSLMAASGMIGNQPLSAALVIADSELAAGIESTVAEAADTNVSVLDPASVLPSSLDTKALSTESGPRIAAIAGATALPSASKPTTIDFKNPKKRPPKKSNARTYMLAAVAAAILLIGGIGWWYSVNSNLNTQLADLQTEIESKETSLPSAQKRVKDLKLIGDFLAASPNWLDELSYISEKIPSSDKVQMYGTQAQITPSGGEITIQKVLADSDDTITEFEESLRDDNHEVLGTTVVDRKNPIGDYKWEVQEKIIVRNRGWDLIDNLKLAKNSSKSTSETESETPAADASTSKDSETDKASDDEQGTPAVDPDKQAGDKETTDSVAIK